MTLNVKVNSDGTPKEFKGKRRDMEKFSDLLFDFSYEKISTLSCAGYVTKEPVSFLDRLSGQPKILSPGKQWANEVFDCAWFHVTGYIPQDISREKLAFRLNCGGEGLIFDRSGNPTQAITCYASEFSRDLGEPVKEIIPIYPQLLDENFADFWIDCGANDLFGATKNQSRLGEMSVVKVNSRTRKLAYDVQILLGVYDYSCESEFRDEIENALLTIMDHPAFTEEWAEKCAEFLKPLMNQKNNGEDIFTFYGVGHAHLDLAWLWPIRETRRKGARTFSTQLRNMERYPDYIFGASQPQLYQWIKDDQPQIYRQVKDAVEAGKWDVQGSTWVEMDSNLISGESMVRQFYYGKEFYEKEFGIDAKVFWIPDSFGYSGCLPQVMKLAGVPYFLTMKISWNLFNKFPYHTFRWQGIDGSTVLAHMLPEDTYNAPVRPDYLIQGEKNYRERKISDIALSAFGIGDGGAGPGYEHIERAERLKDLRGVPRFKFQKSIDFFTKLDQSSVPYPNYQGELYLERHQGTYTTRAENKKFNRQCEFLLRNYEILFCLAKEKKINFPISAEKIDKIWKEVLLYQFHDILPGSSINRVYEETRVQYRLICNTLKNGIDLLASDFFQNTGYYNFNSYTCVKPLKIENKWYCCKIPPFSFQKENDLEPIEAFKASCDYQTIENDQVSVTFQNGCISSLFSKASGRQFVMENSYMGQISQYTDNGDCWDMQGTKANYLATKQDAVCTAFRTYTDGPMACAECTYEIGGCEFHQNFCIYDGDPEVYCNLSLHVRQTAKMLRIAFPTNLRTDEALFNIQFGHIVRKTTENDSVELAQFEVSGQKFVDISEQTCGLSILNDCKYGFRVKHGIIDMNLVRSPKGGPGINVDQGDFTVKYGIFPHCGKLGTETYKKAYELNNPLLKVNSLKTNPVNDIFYHSDNDAIILETIKHPRDGRGIIARFYNTSDCPQKASAVLKGYRMEEIVNIMEEKLSDKTDGVLCLGKFELINLRFVKI